jgi:hypothetical protein
MTMSASVVAEEPKKSSIPMDAREHQERSVGKRIYCVACGLTKPKRGGWDSTCRPVPVAQRQQLRT